MKNLDGNISMNQREKIKDSIDMLSSIRDAMIGSDKCDQPIVKYWSELMLWLVDQLKESLLVLNAIPDE